MTTQAKPIPAHGTEGRYHGVKNKRPPCRCDSCTRAVRLANVRRLRNRAAHGSNLVSRDRLLRHVNRLIQSGMTQAKIARDANVGAGTIYGILHGTVKGCHRDKAMRILAVRPADDHYRLVSAIGTRRRLQALAYVGWPFTIVAQRAGISPKTASAAMTAPAVYAGTARAVAEVFDDLAERTPEKHGVEHGLATWTRKRARREGFQPPIAWDDDTIDDPATEPSLGERVPRYMAIAEDAMWLAQQDFTREQIADRLGVTRDRVQQSLRKHQDATAEQTLALEEEGFTREQIAEQLNVTTDYLQYALSRHAQRQEQTTSTPDLTGEIGELEVAA